MLSNDEVIQQIHHILVYTDFPDMCVYLLGNIFSKTTAEFYGRACRKCAFFIPASVSSPIELK
jgi:hypothetical protein